MSEKYGFIEAEYATLPAEGEAPTVVQICEWLGVSKSGYYGWRAKPESETARRRELLKIKIKALFEANNAEYGYRRIHAALVRGGETVDDETVRRCMRRYPYSSLLNSNSALIMIFSSSRRRAVSLSGRLLHS